MKILNTHKLLVIAIVAAILSTCDSDKKVMVDSEGKSERPGEYPKEKLHIEPAKSLEPTSLTSPVGEVERQSKINSQPEPFTEFWPRFKQYLLGRDYEALAELTRFPLLARGTGDAEPVIEYSRNQFPQLIQALLQQPVLHLDEQGNLVESNLLEEVKAMPPLTEQPQQSDPYRRVKDFQFERIDRRWYLVEVYLAAK